MHRQARKNNPRAVGVNNREVEKAMFFHYLINEIRQGRAQKGKLAVADRLDEVGAMGLGTLYLEDLKAFRINPGLPAKPQIIQQLRQMIQRAPRVYRANIQIPSIARLSARWGVPPQEIHEAFQGLASCGYRATYEDEDEIIYLVPIEHRS